MSRRKTKEEYYEFYKNIIESKGGKIISKKYINSRTGLEFYCENGHINKKTTDCLKKGNWCGECYNGNVKYNNDYREQKIKELNEIIINKNGKLISKKYINNHTKLKICCENNHNFSMISSDLKKGVWCKTCHFNKIKKGTFIKYKTLIEKYGGECITTLDTYEGVEHKITWKCPNDHVQKINPKEFIVSTNHCTICYKKQKLSIESMKQIAIQRGGECLSDKYINNKKN